jgi:CheY-like chemotaxis protein
MGTRLAPGESRANVASMRSRVRISAPASVTAVTVRAHRPPVVRVAVLPRGAGRATIHAMGQTVLIVDDHAGFRASARRLLECEGFEVVGEAADGASAIEAVRELSPDVVLLDVQLPDVNGIEAAERMVPENGRPAIVLTSSRDVSYLTGALAESPARGFIPKSELSGAALRKLVA